MAQQDLHGTVAVVTGASDGIGAVAARELADAGASVVAVGRSPDKTARVAERVGGEPRVCDFADLDAVRSLGDELAAAHPRIGILLNNAGGMFDPSERTVQGHEPNLQVNHLAPFLLTARLRGPLTADDARVVTTSSVGNLGGRVVTDDLDRFRHPRTAPLAYAASKQMNILFARGLAARWGGDGVVSAAVHPGAVASSFGRGSALFGLLYRTPLSRVVAITSEEGAAPLVALATRPDPESVQGRYFHRFRADGWAHPRTRDDALVDALWQASERLVAE